MYLSPLKAKKGREGKTLVCMSLCLQVIMLSFQHYKVGRSNNNVMSAQRGCESN